MASIALLVAVLGGCGLMLWASHKMEPHWTSKDGERMICYGQGLLRSGEPVGRWRELRITKIHDGTLQVRARRGTLSVHDRFSTANLTPSRSRAHAPKVSYWTVAARSEAPQRNRVVFILRGNNDPNMPDMIAIKVPLKSRAVPVLQAMIKRAETPSESSRETLRSEARPDRG